MSDKNFPPSSGDSSKPILVANVSTGPEGPAAVYAYPAGPVVPIPCDNDGSNPVYTSATSDILVYQDGLLLTGWTMAYITGSNCDATVNNGVEPRTVTIDNVTAISGYADFTATKAGVILSFRVYFSKMPQGEQGIQGIKGDQGDKGDTGLTGAAGTDGTGLAMLKFTVSVKDEFTGTVGITDSGGFMRLTFSVDPGLVETEWLYMQSITPTWQYDGYVTAVIGGGVYDTNVVYEAGGTMYVWSYRNFRKGGPWPSAGVNAVGSQDLYFDFILPVGAKLDEVAVMKTEENTIITFWSAGYQPWPLSGYDRYMASELLNTIGHQEVVNLWDPSRYGYTNRILLATNPYRSFFFRCQKYLTTPPYYWNTAPTEDIVHELFVSYKYFPTVLT